jgi:glycosyltransferase involved in cell wall biosynthesis
MLTPSYYPIIGGAETAIRLLAMGLNSSRIQTDVMTFNMDKLWLSKWTGRTEMSDDGFRIFRIPALNWYPLAHSNRITMGVNLIPGRFTNLAKSYDIFHFHSDLSFPVFSYFSDKPKIFHLHGIDFPFLKRYSLARFVLKNIADLYISLTDQMKSDLVKLGLPEEKIRSLPNGLDTKLFHPSNKKEDNLLLFVGRISPGKGLHVLLKSLKHLKRAVRVAIIGPPDWDSEYFNHILRLIQKENEKGKHAIEYIGEKSQTELVDWYQRASVFVLPSIYEGLGIVNLEALACETPVVATKVGGIPEIVRNGEDGILVEPNNPLEIADAIQYLLDNDDVRKEFGRTGRNSVVEHFSSQAIVRKLVKIYKELAQ